MLTFISVLELILGLIVQSLAAPASLRTVPSLTNAFLSGKRACLFIGLHVTLLVDSGDFLHCLCRWWLMDICEEEGGSFPSNSSVPPQY